VEAASSRDKCLSHKKPIAAESRSHKLIIYWVDANTPYLNIIIHGNSVDSNEVGERAIYFRSRVGQRADK
jgi:hypothetical protein